MSGPHAHLTRRKLSNALLLLGAVGLGALVCAPAQSRQPAPQEGAKEEPKQPPTKEPDANPDQPDGRDPLPADNPRRKAFERLQIPRGHERAVFKDVEDFTPVAREDVRRTEYLAWIEFLLHAKNQTTSDLNEYAIRDLVPLDLIRSMRASYRTELLRFDGKLTCVRRLVAPTKLKEQGVTELYEARLTPVDESPLTPVALVFTELPEALAAVKARKPDEWMDADGWVTASGYFFKTMNVPGEKASEVTHVPVLVGRGLTVHAGRPAFAAQVALEKKRIYEFIKEDAKMIRVSPTEVTWPEVAAENRIVLHASRFTAAELEQHATTGLSFADLFKESRLAHKLTCVKFEGRLISLKRAERGPWLTAAGVPDLFEGWLVPADEPRGHPICVLFTDPVPGLEPGGIVNQWVTFAGFSFKRMRYESAEPDEKHPGRNVEKYAPLLIGRGAVPRNDPVPVTSGAWAGFIQAALAAVALLILCAGAFAWYYRTGDRKAKQEITAVRNRNPFDPSAAPPA